MLDAKQQAIESLEASRKELRLAMREMHPAEGNEGSGRSMGLGSLVSLGMNVLRHAGWWPGARRLIDAALLASPAVSSALLAAAPVILHRLQRWGRRHPWALVSAGASFGGLLVNQRRWVWRAGVALALPSLIRGGRLAARQLVADAGHRLLDALKTQPAGTPPREA